jgi:PadR family transcriptional regulator PadR
MHSDQKPALLQGSLDLLILQALSREPRHGYAIVRHLKTASRDFIEVEEGSLYPALHRMERKGWIRAYWGVSESNRRARFYELSPEGSEQLHAATEAWKNMSSAINAVLRFQT